MVSGLWTSWRAIWDQQGKKVQPSPDLLAQAVLVLCRAHKNREADELLCFVDELKKTGWAPAVPHYALDVHTERGRQKLRSVGVRSGSPEWERSWWEEGTKLAAPAGQSRYHSRLQAYGARPGAAPAEETAHEIEAGQTCERCGCLTDVACAECGAVVCLGHATPCEGLCGAYWCPTDRPALAMCSSCVQGAEAGAPN